MPLLYKLTFFLSTFIFVRRAREEQLWEQQRIVTQLKRNLRHAKSVKTVQEQDYEEELNFSLQTPAVPVHEPQQQISIADTKQQIASKTGVHQQQEVPPATAQQQQLGAGADGFKGEKESVNESSPEEGSEHRVTVQIHQDQETQESKNVSAGAQVTPTVSTGHVTVIQCNQIISTKPTIPLTSTSDITSKIVTSIVASRPLDTSSGSSTVSTMSVTASKPVTSTIVPTKSTPPVASQLTPGSAAKGEQVVTDQGDNNQSEIMEQGLEMTQSSPNSTQQFASQVYSHQRIESFWYLKHIFSMQAKKLGPWPVLVVQ